MKKLLFALLYHTGATRLATCCNRKRVMILCYHGVTKRTERSPRDKDGLHVRVDRFARHLDFLQRRYRVISLRDFLKAQSEGRSLPANSVILTFDDGYRNFLTAAAPCLSERRFPATVFLITDRMRDDKNEPAESEWATADDETCLSWSEAKYLSEAQMVEFGSHTCTHQKLSTLSDAQSEQEMGDSQAAISMRLRKNDLALAYPYGDYSLTVAEQAKLLGYSCALTTEDGANQPGADIYALRRTLIGDNDDEASFAVRVSGIISWVSRRKRSAAR